MIAVNLGDAAWSNVLRQKFASADDGKTQIRQAALISPARGVANHDWKDIAGQVVEVGPPEGTGKGKPPVSAADVEHHRRLPLEERHEIDNSLGDLFQGGFCPTRRIENLPGNRDAEFLFDASGTWSNG